VSFGYQLRGRITPFGLTEVGRTQQAVFLQLWKVGWKIAAMQGVPAGIPMPYISDDCASMSVSAIPPKAATQKTRDAASALQSVLNRVLSDNIPVGLAGTPVSYTHLDVYKRQQWYRC